MSRFIASFILVRLVITVYMNVFLFASAERIDCFPERESTYSNYSKEACLARNCQFDDNATPDVIQCFLQPNYGYIVQSNVQQTENGMLLRLRRNRAINSMFPEPIDNVILEVQYYTNDIIRFKLYDEDHQRYEV